MSAISSQVLTISRDPRQVGGNANILTVSEIITDGILTNELDNALLDPAGSIDAATLAFNTTISGDQLGVSNGIAVLNADGDLSIAQIPAVVSAGLDAKGSCRVKTNTALPAYTASGSGVGKTMTADAAGALPTIDGVSLTTGDRILVDQDGSASNVDNGIYTITTIGDGATAWVLTRATDLNETTDISAGVYTFIEEGTLYALKGFIIETPNPITIDITATEWSTFSSGLTGITNTTTTAVGRSAGISITTGVGNTTIGVGSLTSMTSGDNTTAIGTGAAAALTTQDNNTAVGFESMNAATCSSNTAVGAYSCAALTTATNATAVGVNTLTALTTGNNNSALGADAATGITGAGNTAAGSQALLAATNASNATAMGAFALTALTTGAGNTAVGTQSLLATTTQSNNTAVGATALQSLTAGDTTAVGAAALQNATGAANAALGATAGNTITTGNNNLAVGRLSDAAAAAAVGRMSVGHEAISGADYRYQIGYNGVSAGTAELQFRTQTVISETFIGNGNGLCGVDNSGNFEFISGVSMTGIVTAQNTALGDDAFSSYTSGVSNTVLGVSACSALTTARRNIAIGDNTLAAITANTSGDANSENVAVGSRVLAVANNASGTGVGTGGNTAVGDNSSPALTTGAVNTTVGYNTADALTTGDTNVVLGASAAAALTGGDTNIVVGSGALDAITTEQNNIAIGDGALAATTADNLTVIGTGAGAANTTAKTNTALGHGALASITTAVGSTAMGASAAPLSTGANTSTLGAAAATAATTSALNTIIGSGAASTLTTGTPNIIIGAAADVSAAGAIRQIAIGVGAVPVGDYGVQLGRNADDGVGTLRFKSQTIASEAWVGGGTTGLSFDDNGNAIRSSTLITTTEDLSVAGGSAADPDVDSSGASTTFIITTGAGTATGELGDGDTRGQLKYLMATSITTGVEYHLDVSTSTTVLDVAGATINTIKFSTTGNSAALIWNDTNSHWLITSAGVHIV